MRPSVYIDTTIPSYYVDLRPSLSLHIARTRQWWDRERELYDVYVSDFVVLELQEGQYPGKDEAMRLVSEFRRLAATPEIENVVNAYLAHRLMPSRDVRDAFHLAFASHYKIDFLLTWNCHHLANARKQRHIRTINAMLGLNSPLIVTPLELLPMETEDSE